MLHKKYISLLFPSYAKIRKPYWWLVQNVLKKPVTKQTKTPTKQQQIKWTGATLVPSTNPLVFNYVPVHSWKQEGDSQFFPQANQPLGIYIGLFFADLGVILMAATYHFTNRETEEHRELTRPCVRKQQVSIPIPFHGLFWEERQDHGTVLILCSSPAADKFSESQLRAKKLTAG